MNMLWNTYRHNPFLLPFFLFIILVVLFGSRAVFTESEQEAERGVATDKETVAGETSEPQNDTDPTQERSSVHQTVIDETTQPEWSASDVWWLSSGGMLTITPEGMLKTIHGPLEKEHPWYQLYARNNPRDTDGGAYPQNVFRLLTQTHARDFEQQAYFFLEKYRTSDSTFRNESNGMLLLSRFQDQNNVYYAGLRVDGAAVIKKKQNGTYHTLAYRPVFKGNAPYDRHTTPLLLPKQQWIGIKTRVQNTSKGTPVITLWLDTQGNGEWRRALQAEDTATPNPLTQAGRAGIRTDFMDVQIKDHEITEL